MGLERHPLSPRLDRCPEGLPREAYLSDAWYGREMATVFARQWICVGRLSDFRPGTLRRVRIGDAPVIVARPADGPVAAFHNVCRHRGAELCRTDEAPLSRLITCPYHAFAYAADDGRLVSTAFARPTPDFDRAEHGLLSCGVKLWNGFLFLSAASAPPPLWSDVPATTLDGWPMADLVVGHRFETELACNWKVFWENYSECLHCPGIHPELCDLVPVYGTGVMAPSEALGWTPEDPPRPALRPGAETWTASGKPCGPVFPGLTEAERAAGSTFVTLWPSMFVVAHVDHARAVRIEPLSATRTRLSAEWLFSEETLARPGFDAAEVAVFATLVLRQDGEAAEMNQRGLASPAFSRGRLMPEEYEIDRFHRWLRAEMEVLP